jgi:hypothetical protein
VLSLWLKQLKDFNGGIYGVASSWEKNNSNLENYYKLTKIPERAMNANLNESRGSPLPDVANL